MNILKFLIFKLVYTIKINIVLKKSGTIVKSIIRKAISDSSPDLQKNIINFKSIIQTDQNLKKSSLESNLTNGVQVIAKSDTKYGQQHSLVFPDNLGYLNITNELKKKNSNEDYKYGTDKYELNVSGEINNDWWKYKINNFLKLRIKMEHEYLLDDVACLDLFIYKDNENNNNNKDKLLKTVQPKICKIIMQSCNEYQLDIKKCLKTKLQARICNILN